MPSFAAIRDRAERRKGGAAALSALLPPMVDQPALAEVADDRILSAMAKRIFSAGFVWRVIEAKWPGFEEAFLGFDPPRLLFEPDEFWERLTLDTRIVRNARKIMAVRANAAFVRDISVEHDGFGRFLAGLARGGSDRVAGCSGAPGNETWRADRSVFSAVHR